MKSPFDAIGEYQPVSTKRTKIGLKCPVCGEPVVRGEGAVQQTVHWNGSLIRRRVCSQGHHFESEERVTQGKYKEFQAGWRRENAERISEYNRKYRGSKGKKEARS